MAASPRVFLPSQSQSALSGVVECRRRRHNVMVQAGTGHHGWSRDLRGKGMAAQPRKDSVIHEAVLFFDQSRVVKEMLFMEFAAVLDQVVGIPEFADREMQACFLRISPRLRVTGAVFFLIDFDPRGNAASQWNIPLQRLLEAAGRGPDLGAGRIRLACRSQCPISWHQHQLWDPELEGEHASFRQIARAIRRNRLGIPALEDDDEVPLVDVQRSSPAELPREDQSLRLATLKSEYQEQVDQLHRRYRSQLTRQEESLAVIQQELRDEKRRNHLLKEKFESQVAEFQRLRERWQQELASARDDRDGRQGALREQMELEVSTRVGQATEALREQLDMREVELFYREEQLGSLREEVNRLRQEREALVQHSGDRVLRRLVEAGVSFVAYQPGAEAMSIPLAEVPRYLESPRAYTAARCFVTEALYEAWLAHFELPVCAAGGDDGDLCGEPVAKVSRPNQFMPGVSDRCPRHADVDTSVEGVRHGG